MLEKTKALKKKVTGAVGSALSLPSRIKEGRRGARYDSDRKVLQTAKAYDNAPNFNDDGSITDAYKTRFMAKVIRDKYTNK